MDRWGVKQLKRMTLGSERRPQVLHALLDSRPGVAKLCTRTADNVMNRVRREANRLRVPVLHRLLETIAVIARALGIWRLTGAQGFAQRSKGIKHGLVTDVCHV